MEWGKNGRQVRHEFTIVIYQTQEGLELGDIARDRSLFERLELAIGRLKARRGDLVSQILDRGLHEGTLVVFEAHSSLVQSTERFVQRAEVSVVCRAGDEDVIQVHTDVRCVLQKAFHGSLEDPRGGGYTKREAVVSKQSLVGVDRGVLPGVLSQGYLLIGMGKIKCGECLTSQ